MVTDDTVIFGGTTSSKPSVGTGTVVETPKPQTPAYQPPQQTTNKTANPTAKQEQTKGNVTPVNADDDFLNGFNSVYEDEPPTTAYSPEQTSSQVTKPSTWDDVRKELSNKGITAVTADPEDYKYTTAYDPLFDEKSRDITVRALREKGIAPVYDDFLRGFNKDYEENDPATVPDPRDPSFLDLTVNSFKQGYNNAARGQEAWKFMHGQENKLDKYNELLSSDEYNFETDDWWEKILSGASQQVGQWVRQLTDPETAALAMGSGGAALLAGQAGPQALLPEEVLTVPGAFALGMKAGNAKTNMEIEGGNAYLEMLENGVSEETARAIATGVGGVNAALDTLQLDELLKAYKILNKAGADDTLLDILVREVTNRTIDTAVETGQEVLQEGVTIGGTQLGSKMDTGEWVYNLGEVGNRLWDTAKESALTFGLTNIPSTVHNVSVQNHNRLVAAGEANILAGKLPTAEQLQAMNMSEAEALGKMAVLQMGDLDDAVGEYSTKDSISSVHSKAEVLEKNRLRGKIYEQHGFSKFSQQYSFAEEQITIKTDSDVRVRVDAIGLDSDSNVVINEFKSSATAPLTKNQKIAFEEIPDTGGTVVGKGKGIFTGGYRVPEGTRIEIIRPD